MAATREKARYRDLGRLGTGGMGTVTLAEDLLLQRRVALKRVHGAGDEREIARLRREALVGASLNHRNLVAVYDVFETEDCDLVIVMEYVEGETLRQAIRRRGAFPADQAIPVLRALADALDALHDRGIVHRDVKPENILLGSETVKLADLGIARTAEQTQTTAGGAVPGTFSYMAPEQLEGREQGPPIDIYALAVVAFEMLCGRKARRESNPVALAHAIATRPPPDLREEWPQAPAQAATLLRTAMSPDPARRPGSARVLVDRLGDALRPRARPTPRAPATPRRPRLPAPPPIEAGYERGPRAAPAQPKSPVRGTPAPRATSAHRGGEREAGSPAGAPPAVLLHARKRTSGRGPRIAACLALLIAIGLLAALVGFGGSGGPSHVRSTSARKGAHDTAASQRKHASHASSHRTPAGASEASGAGAETAASPISRPTGAADAGRAPPREPTPPSPVPTVSGAGSPSTAVQSFYGAAARHDYTAAWQLADANMRAQLAGFESFRAQQSAVRSITFHRAQVVSGGGGPTATVAVETTAVLADRTEQCSGTVRLLRSQAAASWLLDGISIDCVP